MSNNFQGKAGQQVPEMTEAVVSGITARYEELYEGITGEKIDLSQETDDLAARIEKNVTDYLTK